MVTERKATGRALSMPAGLALGAVISLVLTLVLAGVIAWLIDTGRIPVLGIGYGAMITLFIAAIVGAWTACGRIKRMRLQVCLLSGVIYYLLLVSITALFFGGQFRGMGVTAAVVGCGTIVVILAGFGKGRGRDRRHRYKPSR